jgi:5-methylcytosine-specific restriction endonuclease McrA
MGGWSNVAAKKAAAREWYVGHREVTLLRAKARAAADPEGRRAYLGAYYLKHRAVILSQAKAWRHANPERWRASHRIVQGRRRARQVTVANDLTRQEWSSIVEYFGSQCAYCLRSDQPITIDHIEPIARGGPHSASNVVPACRRCNSSKRHHSLLAFLVRGSEAYH